MCSGIVSCLSGRYVLLASRCPVRGVSSSLVRSRFKVFGTSIPSGGVGKFAISMLCVPVETGLKTLRGTHGVGIKRVVGEQTINGIGL